MSEFQTGKILQENTDQFFEKVFDKHKDSMKCGSGCDGCCHASFSIHPWEAFLIIEWFDSMDDKEEMKALWNRTQPQGKDAQEAPASPCAFLYEGKCSIYPARAIICRTQGLPLNLGEKVDTCPLNFKKMGIENIPKNDWLELNRLNMLSSLAQSSFEKQNQIEFLNQERIELSKLKEFLTHR